MFLETSSFMDGGNIPLEFTEPAAGGKNHRPALNWGDLPEGTKSLAITVYDPDAPTGSGFWHWIATDIPADLTELASDAQLPDGAIEWMNDYGYSEYGGPCPPENRVHRHIFTLHALPVEKLELPENLTSAQVRFNIFAQQLEAQSVTGKFQQPS